MHFLVLRLAAPLMSFGDVAVDEIRPSKSLPNQSQMTGLIANALGYRFTHARRLQRLQDRLIFGARLDKQGELLRDFQTAQLAKRDLAWRTRNGPAKRAGGDASFSGPTLRQRYYRADSRVSVVVSLVPEDEQPEIEIVAKALASPFRPLFLGRVSCPPAEPLFQDERVEAANVHSALEKASAHTGNEGFGIYAEWPAEGPGGLYPSGQVPGEVVQVPDLRDWGNDIHAGSRLLARGMVQPATRMPTREVRQ